MKNIFKSLMFVAVAAMTFTACEKDNNEANKAEQKTVINGVATIDNDDTRSGFNGTVEEGGKTYYQSAWDGNENILVYYGDTAYNTTIDAEGRFTVTIDGNLPDGAFISVCSPASAWTSVATSVIPAVQTPRADSVDPAAHILGAQNIQVYNGSAIATLSHQAAYGKMTVNTPAGFVIDNVVIELNGTYYGDKSLTYTLEADNVENNTFWFATEPVNVDEFTVIATNEAGDAYSKTVTIPADRELNFNWGRVATFSVSELVEYEAPTFTSVTYNDNPNDKILIFNSDKLGTLKVNFYPTNGVNTIDVGLYSSPSKLYVSSTNYAYYQPVDGEITAISYITADVSVVENKYMFVFHVEAGEYTIDSSYHGLVSGLEVPDPRTKLATPTNLTSSVDGLNITLSWDAVTGADSYYISYTNGGVGEFTTTNTSFTIECDKYDSYYGFLVRAIANADNPTYKNSDDVTLDGIKTGKDPNKVADFMWTTIDWSNSNYVIIKNPEEYNSCYWYIYINEADRPNGNSIKPGRYTCAVNNTSPAQGQFCVRIYEDSWTSINGSIYPSNTTANDTLEVTVDENGVYTIVYTHVTTYVTWTHGYKGEF